MANQMDFRRATRARMLRRRGASDINSESESASKDAAAQWLARNGGAPLPPKDWKTLRKRKKARRKLQGMLSNRQRKKLRSQRKKKMPKGTIVVSEVGPPCPRCMERMQVREHAAIKDKHLRQPYYYSRWHYCTNMDCRTTLVMPEEFKVLNATPPIAGEVTWGDSWDEVDAVTAGQHERSE